MKKNFAAGSISIALFILAVVWSINIKSLGNFCLGDVVLNAIGLQAWSDGSYGTHYAIFYGIVFLIPAILVGIKFRDHVFARSGMICSITLTCILLFTFYSIMT